MPSNAAPQLKQFAAAYQELMADIENLDKEMAQVHREMLQAIDQKKMAKVLSKIKTITE